MLVWKKATPGNLPSGAVPCGYGKIENAVLYAVRAAYEGGTHIGKVWAAMPAHIPFGGKEILIDNFEVLCVDSEDIHAK